MAGWLESQQAGCFVGWMTGCLDSCGEVASCCVARQADSKFFNAQIDSARWPDGWLAALLVALARDSLPQVCFFDFAFGPLSAQVGFWQSLLE